MLPRPDQCMRRWLVGLVAALLLPLAYGVQQESSGRADPSTTCDHQKPATVIFANSQQVDSRAYWLNEDTLRWPSKAPSGKGTVFRLVASWTAALKAQVGEPLRGEERGWVLNPLTPAQETQFSKRMPFTGSGIQLRLSGTSDSSLRAMHRAQTLLVQEDASGRVIDFTRIQSAVALDALFAPAASAIALGPRKNGSRFTLSVWAPTAQALKLCVYPSAEGGAHKLVSMRSRKDSGVWSVDLPEDVAGAFYRFEVTVFVPGHGLVRNLVTDPYSVSLSADSLRSQILDLDSPSLSPPGWRAEAGPRTVRHTSDMSIYELHVRDFSILDDSVPMDQRGKFLAFTHPHSRGMRHLMGLAKAGLTDIHLLPVFDFASVPEVDCVTPAVDGEASGEKQQAIVRRHARDDCFNWGYDPFHFNAPEGSYASNPSDGRTRIVEFRKMVQALHRLGLRVGMDVVFNHTSAAGQHPQSVLDRIVPGYYHRLDSKGEIERSTCCDNTATEHRMMEKLMSDSVLLWALQYKIDSFRFDLMGHQPRHAMVSMQRRVQNRLGKAIQFIGEGWNFGEVANNARFIQASQNFLGGTGIASFNDRLRDAVRGGHANDSPDRIRMDRGYISVFPLEIAESTTDGQAAKELMKMADRVRAGVAGSIKSYVLEDYQGSRITLDSLPYGSQNLAYARNPAEVVNYVENHDNLTLWDSLAFKLPTNTTSSERARVQTLGSAFVALSQGIAYFHAGQDILRSKSLDGNSYDSGDWFNRLDWRYQTNHFGSGLPPKPDNGQLYALMRPLLESPDMRPSADDIAFSRDAFRDLLKIRYSSTLLRLPSAQAIRSRLTFFNVGPEQNPALICFRLDGRGLAGANYSELLVFLNVDVQKHAIMESRLMGNRYRLHPVHLAADAADQRPAQLAPHEVRNGLFDVPARTALVYVAEMNKSSKSNRKSK